MTSDDPYDFAFVPKPFVVRKPPPPEPDPIYCVIGQHDVRDGPWTKPAARSRAPVCNSCARHWSYRVRSGVLGMTRGDHSQMLRLSALITAITWESYNGRFAK